MVLGIVFIVGIFGILFGFIILKIIIYFAHISNYWLFLSWFIGPPIMLYLIILRDNWKEMRAKRKNNIGI
jgi:hypothetical protein